MLNRYGSFCTFHIDNRDCWVNRHPWMTRPQLSLFAESASQFRNRHPLFVPQARMPAFQLQKHYSHNRLIWNSNSRPWLIFHSVEISWTQTHIMYIYVKMYELNMHTGLVISIPRFKVRKGSFFCYVYGIAGTQRRLSFSYKVANYYM